MIGDGFLPMPGTTSARQKALSFAQLTRGPKRPATRQVATKRKRSKASLRNAVAKHINSAIHLIKIGALPLGSPL